MLSIKLINQSVVSPTSLESTIGIITIGVTLKTQMDCHWILSSILKISIRNQNIDLKISFVVPICSTNSDFPDTDENGTILNQNEGESQPQPQPVNTETRIESLSREVSPKPRDTNYQSENGGRKRTRSQ